MKSFSITATALGAAALGLLANSVAAQAPLVPLAPLVAHHHALRLLAPTAAAAAHSILSGPSLVSAPHLGQVPVGPLVPGAVGQATPNAATDPFGGFNFWIAQGPSPIHNAAGAFGYDGPDNNDAGKPENVSGRVVGLAPDPSDKSGKTFYIASAGGGVWKTTDGGLRYIALTDFLGDTAMGCITVAPQDTKVIYAGTGEANFAGDSRYGIGVLVSRNGGVTWKISSGPTDLNNPKGVFYRKAISKIVVDPSDLTAKTVYLTTCAAGLNGNGYSNGGVWKTTDGGASWTNLTATQITPYAAYTDLAINSHRPNILYTAVGYPGAFSGLTPKNGVWKSTDSGATWTKLAGGLPAATLDAAKHVVGDPVGGQNTLALWSSPDGAHDVLYVSLVSYKDYGLLGLYKSVDSGASFAKLTVANYLGGQGFYDNAVAVSPKDPSLFFAGGQVNYGAVGLFYSPPIVTNYQDLRALVGTRDGVTFHDYSLGRGYYGPHTDTHALAFTPDGRLLDANDGGVFRLEAPFDADPVNVTEASADVSNIVWSDLNTTLNTIQCTGIGLDPTDPAVAYEGAQDNGTSRETAFKTWNQILGGDGGYTRVDKTNPNTLYAEFYGISLLRSDDGGLTFNDATHGINPADPFPDFNLTGTNVAGRNDASAFYVPYKLDPLNQSRVLYPTDHLYESLDKGDNYSVIGTPGTAGFNPADATVDTLAVAGKTVYAEAGGAIYATFDDGVTWQDRSIPGFTSTLGDSYVDPANPQDVIFVNWSFDGGKVFRSTNGGLTWADITGNLPDEPVNAIQVDKKSGIVYVGADDGVYASTNFGGSWTRIPGSLPTVQVVDLDLSNSTGLLGVGTHGRGLWTTPLSRVIATPNLITRATLTRLNSTTVQVIVTVLNTASPNSPQGVGAADALNTVIKSISLNGHVQATPVSLGAVAPYSASKSAFFTFIAPSSGSGVLEVSGTYDGGRFGGSLKVAVP